MYAARRVRLSAAETARHRTPGDPCAISSPRTEEVYVHWIQRFIVHHGKRHPRELGAAEVTQFLTDLAVRQRVGAAVLPGALDRKYPNASKDWRWQFVFPADCPQVPDLADCAWLRTNGRNCLSVSDESRTEPAVYSNTC
jgi:hypothetical protein